jgi:Xaa-Pro aminopeptidase
VIEKAIKNPTELQGFRNCSLRDAAALVEYFAWLADYLAQGKQISEFEAAQQLLEFRKLVTFSIFHLSILFTILFRK